MTTGSMDSALWALGRGTGVAALGLFTVAVVLGIAARSGRPLPILGRAGLSDLHRTAALTATFLIVVHVTTLVFDPFAQLKLADAVLPFTASYRPLWVGLGTLAVDLLLAVTVASVLRARIGPRTFRAIHWATYGLWMTAIAHALGSGSDAGSTWFRAGAVLAALTVAVAIGWRLAPSFSGRGWTRQPRRVA